MSQFQKHRRKGFVELREVTSKDIKEFSEFDCIYAHLTRDSYIEVSISEFDRLNGSPKIGDMIARNPKNHLDQWLVAEDYYKENFEKL